MLVDGREVGLFPVRRLWLTYFEVIGCPILEFFGIVEGVEEIASSSQHVAIDLVVLRDEVFHVHSRAFAHDLRSFVLTVPDVLEPDARGDVYLGSESTFGIYLTDLVARDLVVGFGACGRQP
ncbi:hypothetical protein HG530_006868 [Fusarium avenaceum]|nr:hypothetical protein HG530_006868 [Fusarium avenaceum]